MSWVFYALSAMVLFSGMHLVFKKLGVLGVSSSVMLFFIFLAGAIAYPLYIYFTGEKVLLNKEIILWIFLAAVLSIIANLLSLKAFLSAPNPGYTTALGSLGAIIVTVASYFIFASEITAIKFAGIILGILAVILITI